MYRPNRIKRYGEHFQKHSFVHCGWQDNLPVFARILDILIASNFPLLAVELYSTERLDSNLQSYCVKRTHKLNVLYMAHLENGYPLEAHTYLGDRQTYIALRSQIFNMNWVHINCKNSLWLLVYVYVTVRPVNLNKNV